MFMEVAHLVEGQQEQIDSIQVRNRLLSLKGQQHHILAAPYLQAGIQSQPYGLQLPLIHWAGNSTFSARVRDVHPLKTLSLIHI